MAPKQSHTYGYWPSEITPGIFANLLKISEPAWGKHGSLFWRERSSSRTKIQMYSPQTGEIRMVSGALNIGGELLYGGGGYTSSGKSLIVIDKKSHQLYQIHPDENKIKPLTSSLRYAASPEISPDGKFVIYVHSDSEVDLIDILDLTGSKPAQPLVSGSDFFNFPRWHPSSNQVAWISWDHPHMPWDSSSLWLAELDRSAEPVLGKKNLIAGGKGISVLQPEFSPDGRTLAYISDQDGWWQIYLFDLVHRKHQQLTTVKAEHGLPPWLQNQRSYQFSPDNNQLYFLRNQEGIRSLWTYDFQSQEERRVQLDEEYTWLEDISISPTDDRIALVASGANIPPRLITAGMDGNTEIIRRSTPIHLPKNHFSIPEPISWPGNDDQMVQGLFYRPQNPKYRGQGKPPLLVIIHSGPTRQKWLDFQPRTQYFTSRGFAVLEVNYRGSTGYGRGYRQALAGNWGETDVDDCLSGSIYLADLQWVDREKMVIMGSSSGGLTVYQILVKYPGIFRAGIILYGIANHLTLLKNPPKFERFYSEWLIGPYPEAKDLYHQRSPVFFAEKIQDPVAIFQGSKDRIVPQDQAEQIITELEKNQVPFLYRLYPEEGHSFKNIATLEDFYSQLEIFLSFHL